MRYLTLLIALAVLQGCATMRPTNLNDACSILRDKPQWYEAAVRSERKWRLPVQIQLAIIYHESTFRADARPNRTLLGVPLWRRSSAYGYAQAKDGTWDWYRDKTGNHSGRRTDFADATDFIGWYADISRKTLGISKWDAYNQYLAYHEGHGGWRRKTYGQKAWLIKTARRVEARARRYGGQLRACREELQRNGGPRLF